MSKAFRPLLAPLLRILLAMALFTAQRWLFVLANSDAFPQVPFSHYLIGLRFDLSAIAWVFLPWLATTLIHPAPTGWLARSQYGLYMLSTTLCAFLNCTDIAYYAFTLKRSTADLFGIATGGSDILQLAPVFAQDFWYIVLLFLGFLVIAHYGYRAITRWESAGKPWWAWRALLLTLIIVAGRGGFQLIPLGVIDAVGAVPPQQVPVVLNTPFTVMTSLGKPVLPRVDLLPQAGADHHWPVHHCYGAAADSSYQLPARPNVVVLVLESFSAAYSARLNPGRAGYMPFLDSLMTAGLSYKRAYANGRRSIDGIPAVFASMPKLMSEAFITSPYATTPYTALPALLRDQGYATAFFHGGNNGTMGFDGFAKSAGFQRYLGRNEYPHTGDDDGTWGIRDRPFLQYMAAELSGMPQPFMAGVFTLSSHHPYKLTAADEAAFAGGTHPIHPTMRYTDDALRRFFATVRTQPWFGNTLFVITADHTADLERNGETAGAAYDHWIPLIYYMPGRISPKVETRTTQQIDILPTVLDLIGYREPFFAFGSSSLRNERIPAAVSESSGTWLLISDSIQFRTDGHVVRWSETIGNDSSSATPLLPVVQAAIQQYNSHVGNNSLRYTGPCKPR